MDRNFYHQKAAQEHQHEISRELANRHLLNEAGGKFLTAKRARWIAFRLAPVTIIITLLMLHFLG